LPHRREVMTSVSEEKFPKEPQENILYFLEKHAPRLDQWKREVLRIVRKISQYFYPQYQTKVMNEAFATFMHYNLIHDLHEQGYVGDGGMTEFYRLHTSVLMQWDYDSKYYGGINPYALGYSMLRDIKRVSLNPTEEDRSWFANQAWVGNGDWIGNIKYAVKNFKDDSFVLQYLSPHVMREFKLFTIRDDEEEEHLTVSGIHNEHGYREIRSALSRSYNINAFIPNIQIVEVDRWGDRTMYLEHVMHNHRPLNGDDVQSTLVHLAYLWGYPVQLDMMDNDVDNDVDNSQSVDQWRVDPSELSFLNFNLSDYDEYACELRRAAYTRRRF
jgi:stage V sporulation protein R